VIYACIWDFTGEILHNKGLREDRGQHHTTSEHGGAGLGCFPWLTRFVLNLVLHIPEVYESVTCREVRQGIVRIYAGTRGGGDEAIL